MTETGFNNGDHVGTSSHLIGVARAAQEVALWDLLGLDQRQIENVILCLRELPVAQRMEAMGMERTDWRVVDSSSEVWVEKR